MIAERDRDRYFESLATNFKRFWRVKKELADETEKVRSLEDELARTRAKAIVEYKKSQEFEDFLPAEYNASFPETFKSCWEAIIEELGSKIEGVTLEKYPVPPIPGKTPASPVDLEETEFGDSHPQDSQDEDIQEGVRSPMVEDVQEENADVEEIPEKVAEAKAKEDVFDVGLD